MADHYQRVRLAGTYSTIDGERDVFLLTLRSGEQVRCIAGSHLTSSLSVLGKAVVVEAVAQFSSQEILRHVVVAMVEPATEADLAVWSVVPRPLFAEFRQAPSPSLQYSLPGLGSIIGKWPGDETDEEIFALLEELS